MNKKRPDLFIKDAARRAEKLIENCEKITAACNRICRKSESIKQQCSEDIPYDLSVISDHAQMVQNDLITINWFANLLYKTITEPNTYDGSLPYDAALLTKEQGNFREIFDVRVVVKCDALLVKLPLLPSRYNQKKGGLGKLYFGQWATRELEAKLLQIEQELPTFPTRNIAYLHVISTPNPHTTADADNRDTKSITDTVSRFVGDDGPLECSFSSCSIRAEKLDEGTYLAVTPTFGCPPSLGELVSLFSDLCH